jgi:hypothetical protein
MPHKKRNYLAELSGRYKAWSRQSKCHPFFPECAAEFAQFATVLFEASEVAEVVEPRVVLEDGMLPQERSMLLAQANPFSIKPHLRKSVTHPGFVVCNKRVPRKSPMSFTAESAGSVTRSRRTFSSSWRFSPSQVHFSPANRNRICNG